MNGRETIVDSLDSALGQMGANFDLVVIDGGSTDGTLELLHDYADRLAALVSEPDRGTYDALNKGIRSASGDVFGFLHSDDIFADACVLSSVAATFSDLTADAVDGYVLEEARRNLAAKFPEGLAVLEQFPSRMRAAPGHSPRSLAQSVLGSH